MNDNTPLEKYPGVIWSLPLLFQYEPLYDIINYAYKRCGLEAPRVNLFGSPANVWSGGRVPYHYFEFDLKRLLKVFKFCEILGATPTFTFSSVSLEKDDLNDKYANFLLDASAEIGARYIVFDDRLRDHIKSKHPNATVIASVIKSQFEFQGAEKKQIPTAENETVFYNKLLKEYDMVVVRPEYSKTHLYDNPSLIDDLSKIEVLINQVCYFECPKAPEHYKYFETEKINPGVSNERFHCFVQDIDVMQAHEHNCTHSEEIVRKLVNAGVKNLKLQGRSASIAPATLLMLLSSQMFNLTGKHYSYFSHVDKMLTEIGTKFDDYMQSNEV